MQELSAIAKEIIFDLICVSEFAVCIDCEVKKKIMYSEIMTRHNATNVV